jgi:hypothetical protein
MTSKYWIKLYHEILDDPKMGRLPDALFRRTIELFLIAGDCNRAGKLPPLTDIAWRLRADEIELLTQMEDLEALNILSRSVDGSWRVAHFKERQEASPMAERVRRHRRAERSGEKPPYKASNDTVTDRYTDTDTDADGRGLQEQASEYPAFGGLTPQNSGHLRHLPPQMSTDIPTPQRLPGARAMGIRDLEPEADADSGSGIRDDELVKLFVERTGLPLFMGGEDKWAQALERMKNAGVGAGDLEQAIDECRTKGLTIASLASLVNPAIIAKSRRRAGRPEEDYRRYLKGEYGEFGR